MSSMPSSDVPGLDKQSHDPERLQRLEKYVQGYFKQSLALANPQASLVFIQHLFEKILGESIPLAEIQVAMQNAGFQSFEQDQPENPLYNLAQSDIELLLRDWEQGKI